jgi:hypothetical protein
VKKKYKKKNQEETISKKNRWTSRDESKTSQAISANT